MKKEKKKNPIVRIFTVSIIGFLLIIITLYDLALNGANMFTLLVGGTGIILVSCGIAKTVKIVFLNKK